MGPEHEGDICETGISNKLHVEADWNRNVRCDGAAEEKERGEVGGVERCRLRMLFGGI